MLKKILIANRGEIACRIIRTAKRLGVATVAVYSDADVNALHVEQAGEAVHIGPSPAPESYLRGDQIIAAAKATGADGIHPGYGFLSENADFAEAVTKAGLKFIGPSASAMRALGGKAAAKDIALHAGVPVVPGYQGEKQDAKTLSAESRKIGYPVMIKAVAGGGGRGMRLVEKEADLAELLASAQREAEGAFGNAHVLIEKVIERPRHIEVQVFGDAHGHVVHLFERDCTLQRRNQKVIEEAPAPGMSEALREKMCLAAVKLAKSVGYEGAGTVEFLVEGGSLGPDARWYFIEMNTRLQVEHPVTEEITGLDLVEWQLRVASGEKLPLAQTEIKMSGHAIEVRLCAEDPAKGFLPSVGRLWAYMPSAMGGIRLESGVDEECEISPFYDSMIAKAIAKAPSRGAAMDGLCLWLTDTRVAGVQTNARFLRQLLEHDDVREGRMDTGLIGRDLAALTMTERNPAARAAGVSALIDLTLDEIARLKTHAGDRDRRQSPWSRTDGFQLGAERRLTRVVLVDSNETKVELGWSTTGLRVDGRETMRDKPTDMRRGVFPGAYQAGDKVFVLDDLCQSELRWPTYDASAIDDGAAGDTIRAPINGKVARIFVAEGDTIEKGARIAVVEAMKMEHVLHATRAGTIAKVSASEGQQVTQGTLIAVLAEV